MVQVKGSGWSPGGISPEREIAWAESVRYTAEGNGSIKRFKSRGEILGLIFLKHIFRGPPVVSVRGSRSKCVFDLHVSDAKPSLENTFYLRVAINTTILFETKCIMGGHRSHLATLLNTSATSHNTTTNNSNNIFILIQKFICDSYPQV